MLKDCVESPQMSTNVTPATDLIFLSLVTKDNLFSTAVATIAASGTVRRYARRNSAAIRAMCISTGMTMKSPRKFSTSLTSAWVSEVSESASMPEIDDMNNTAPESRHSCKAWIISSSPFKYPMRILLSRIMHATVSQIPSPSAPIRRALF